MGKYFGTDGFRGEANVTLTADHAFKVVFSLLFPQPAHRQTRVARTRKMEITFFISFSP